MQPSCPDPPTVVVLHALGCRVQVDLTGVGSDDVARFRAAWVRCLDTDGGGAGERPGRDAGVVEADAAGFHEDGADSGHMLLTQRITRNLIEAQAGRLLMFHAGALCDPVTGASIVYVAPGGTGKTTLSRTFGPSLGYLTDETVGITESGRILPYPKPLSTRRAHQPGVKDELSPDALGLGVPAADPWVAGIVLLRREPGLRGVVVEDVEPLDGLVRLGPETSSLARLDRPLHRLLDLIQATGGLRLVRYAEAEQVAGVVQDITGRRR